jgi:hypothetical protein
MSALEIFVRVRQYRNRAAEFFQLAAGAFSLEVRERYLAIADHYIALADAEVRADRLARRKRLEDMRMTRQAVRPAGNLVSAPAQAEASETSLVPEPLQLHVLPRGKVERSGSHGRQRSQAQCSYAGRAQMAAQSGFPPRKSAP